MCISTAVLCFALLCCDVLALRWGAAVQQRSNENTNLLVQKERDTRGALTRSRVHDLLGLELHNSQPTLILLHQDRIACVPAVGRAGNLVVVGLSSRTRKIHTNADKKRVLRMHTNSANTSREHPLDTQVLKTASYVVNAPWPAALKIHNVSLLLDPD